MNGEYCPYLAQAPLTIEGEQAWQIAMLIPPLIGPPGGGGPAGVFGLDLHSGLRLAAAHGLDEAVAAELIGAIAAGMLAAIQKAQS